MNMEGSFKCVCDSGFRIGPDQSHCIGVSSFISLSARFATFGIEKAKVFDR